MPTAAENLHGTWRLARARASDADGNALPPPYGHAPMGTLIFTPQGRMLAALCDGGDGVQDIRAYNSYCGAYSVSDGRLTTHVDAGAPPVRIGGRQVRDVAIRDDMLVLSSVRPSGERRELHWQRIGDA